MAAGPVALRPPPVRGLKLGRSHRPAARAVVPPAALLSATTSWPKVRVLDPLGFGVVTIRVLLGRKEQDEEQPAKAPGAVVTA